MTKEEARTGNTGFASGGLMCKLGALCFYSSSVLVDSLVLRNPPERKAPNVIAQCKKPTAQMAHLVFSDSRANAQKTKRAIFFQRSDRQTERNSNIFYIEKRDIGK